MQIKACENLLFLTNDLKTQMVVSSTQAVTLWRKQRRDELTQYVTSGVEEINSVSSNLSQMLNEVEELLGEDA